MAVVPFRSTVDFSSVPTLVLIDLQQEYVAAPRGLAIPEAVQALDKCREALTHARAMGFPVAFVRWVSRSSFFNQATRFSQWIKGFEPTGADMIFERDKPSCFASEPFAEVMGAATSQLVIAGFAGEAACLSTIIDAFHRGKRITYLADASASHPVGAMQGTEVHDAISHLASLYGEIHTTAEWVAATSPIARKVGSVHG